MSPHPESPGNKVGVTNPMIHRLVHAFYAKVRQDDVLGPVFAAKRTQIRSPGTPEDFPADRIGADFRPNAGVLVHQVEKRFVAAVAGT